MNRIDNLLRLRNEHRRALHAIRDRSAILICRDDGDAHHRVGERGRTFEVGIPYSDLIADFARSSPRAIIGHWSEGQGGAYLQTSAHRSPKPRARRGSMTHRWS